MSRSQRRASVAVFASVVAALSLLFFLDCTTDDNGAGPRPDAGGADGPVCRRPPALKDCDPPERSPCKAKFICRGCNCSGGFSVSACDPDTGDCRFFCSGCYPMSYQLCNQSASRPVLARLCGRCFATDGGPSSIPDCDRANIILDAGSTPPGDTGPRAEAGAPKPDAGVPKADGR